MGNLKDSSSHLFYNINLASTWEVYYYLRFAQIAKLYQSLPKLANRILDIGCSTGKFIRFYQEHFRSPSFKNPDYTGIDYNQKFISKAINWLETHKTRQFYSSTKFVKADITNDLIWDSIGKYDCILALEVLEHIDKTSEQFVVNNLYSKLDDNGLCFISTPVHYKDSEPIFRKTADVHDREYTYQEFTQLVQSKFRVIDTFGCSMEASDFRKMLKSTESGKYYSLYQEFRERHIPSSILIPIFDILLNKNPEQLVLVCRK